MLGRHYGEELKNQIDSNKADKQIKNKIELEKDKIQSLRSQQLGVTLEEQRKMA